MPRHDRLDLARVLLARAVDDETLVHCGRGARVIVAPAYSRARTERWLKSRSVHLVEDAASAPSVRSLRAARTCGSSLSVDRVQLPGVGNALQSVSAPVGELQPRSGH
jgi:hypothetical protein